MNLLYLIILFPLISFIILSLSCDRWTKKTTGIIGVGSIGIAAFITVYVMMDFLSQETNHLPFFKQHLWNWIAIRNFNIDVALMLDGLSLTIVLVILGIGFLIHIFSSWYMRSKEGYARFFAYTNLFVASMLVLVLGDNLLLIYLGWEGVGLCSYLLIGFYYTNKTNGAAAMKAFIMTRISDVFLLFSLFILYNTFGTLNIQELLLLAPKHLALGNTTITLVTLMLLSGAIGKSAQLPFQTWLADAMVGPTPVSALIHSATMVTAGVYLIARTHDLFIMAPAVLYLVGIIGVITILLAGCAALVQNDIKRVLAYSTMSQIGYMFFALGMKAWDAAILHLVIHACFKGLLFLSAGSLIQACHHEQNISKMGGLRKSIPLIYYCFLVGGAALSSFPLITSGFFSKEAILASAMANNHIYLVSIGLIGSFITALYTFRMIFIVFHGKEKIKAHADGSISHNLPLLVMLVLSTCLGWIIVSPLKEVLPSTTNLLQGSMLPLAIISGATSILGVILAATIWLGKPHFILCIKNNILGRFFSNLWFNGWGFDWLYDKVFIKPYLRMAKLLQHDPLNLLINLIAVCSLWGNATLKVSENGHIRGYIFSMLMGALIILTLLLLL